MFKQIKQAFAAFIETCKALTEASRTQTQSIAALHADVKKLEQHASYLATSEEHRLIREGKKHVFKS